MIDTTYLETFPQTEADYEAAIEQMLADMQQLRVIMDSDQAEIDKLKAETAVIKAETRATLDRLKEMVPTC